MAYPDCNSGDNMFFLLCFASPPAYSVSIIPLFACGHLAVQILSVGLQNFLLALCLHFSWRQLAGWMLELNRFALLPTMCCQHYVRWLLLVSKNMLQHSWNEGCFQSNYLTQRHYITMGSLKW